MTRSVLIRPSLLHIVRFYHRQFRIPGLPWRGLFFFLMHVHPSADIVRGWAKNIQKQRRKMRRCFFINPEQALKGLYIFHHKWYNNA